MRRYDFGFVSGEVFMWKVIKKEGKRVKAYEVGTKNDILSELMQKGKICEISPGQFEVFSQEAVNGRGELCRTGDFIKLDGANQPYPNDREYFYTEHKKADGEDLYEQIPKPLDAWVPECGMVEEIRFLINNRGLVLDESNNDKYFTAPLWGTVLSAPHDAVLLFYFIERNSRSEIIDCSFNFIQREEFDQTYLILSKRT